MVRERSEKQVRGLETWLFSTQALSFQVIVWPKNKCCTIGGEANPYHWPSRF